MEQVVLKTQSRTPDRKGAARQTRRAGLVPGVVYGHGLDPQPLSVDARTLETVLRHHRGSNVLLNLQVDGKSPEGLAAIIKALQTDPITDEFLAIDFQWVSLTEMVTVSVAVRLEGVSEGVQAGGVLDQAMYEVPVSCLPLEIPEELILDVSALEIGDTLHVSDLSAPDGVDILADLEEPVVTIRQPVLIVEPEPEEAELPEGEEVPEGEEAPEDEEAAEGDAETEGDES